MSRRYGPKKVLFLGTHGQFNIGDELLLLTFLDQLGDEHAYAVNSYAPKVTSYLLEGRFDVEVFDTTAGKFDVLRKIWWADVVVFGGGSIIKELYASTGRWRYSTLMMVLGIVTAARLLRRPVIMSNIGVGPIDSPFGHRLAGRILRSANLVSVRDSGSLRTARIVGCPSSRILQVPDAVFANKRDVFGAGPLTERDDAPTRVALNMNKDIANPEAWLPFCDNLAVALRTLAENEPIEIHALPMQSRFKADTDLEVLEMFLARLEGIPVFIHEPEDHIDVATIIADCDIVVAERLHAIVIAAIMGCPAVALAYDVKVRELAIQLGIDDTAIDINEPFSGATLAKSINETLLWRSDRGAAMAEFANEKRVELSRYFSFLRTAVASGTVPTTWPDDIYRKAPGRSRATS